MFIGDDDEDDPLDAYMKSLENQAKTKGEALYFGDIFKYYSIPVAISSRIALRVS
jgi:hypothetical protein